MAHLQRFTCSKWWGSIAKWDFQATSSVLKNWDFCWSQLLAQSRIPSKDGARHWPESDIGMMTIPRQLNLTEHNWLVVYLPLWKIWKSVGIIIPNIWKNKIHVPNHQPDHMLSGGLLCCLLLWFVQEKYPRGSCIIHQHWAMIHKSCVWWWKPKMFHGSILSGWWYT